MNAVMNINGNREETERKRDRLKSVPPSAAVKAALAALRIYKMYLSVLFAGSCRFEPTCSMYAYEAIERFGVMRGSWMGLKRLLRCQPLSRKFGYDPVPERNDGMHSNCSAAAQVESRTAVNPREAHS
jgi:putative membrane protein insertion efficiency factor